jgi:hypothetical protein
MGVLDNFMIRFSQTSALNDPFESAVLLDAEKRFENFDPEEVFRKILAEEGIVPGDEDWDAFNSAVKELKEYQKELTRPHALGRQLMEWLDLRIGVLSLSRTNDNLLMWAHYADSHRGLVLGLDDEHPFFHVKDQLNNPTKPYNVVYTSRRRAVDPDARDYYEQLLCQKSIDWAYEEEVRIFRTFDGSIKIPGKTGREDVHLFEMPVECIKEVYIGANASESLRAKMLRLVHRRKLPIAVFDARISDERYEMEFCRVENGFDHRAQLLYRTPAHEYDIPLTNYSYKITASGEISLAVPYFNEARAEPDHP